MFHLFGHQVVDFLAQAMNLRRQRLPFGGDRCDLFRRDRTQGATDRVEFGRETIEVIAEGLVVGFESVVSGLKQVVIGLKQVVRHVKLFVLSLHRFGVIPGTLWFDLRLGGRRILYAEDLITKLAANTTADVGASNV